MLCPVIKLTMQLIRCHSISPKDEGCQEIIIKRLKDIGFKVKHMNFFDTKNFWAWRGYGKTLAFAGHTDVVPAGNLDNWITLPFEPTIRNGMLFGRGSADMKGSIAAMIIATERFVSNFPNHKGRLAFIITSDEESSAKNGTVKIIENLIANNEYIDYCLIGEPSSNNILGDVVKNGRRGSLTCNLTVHGIQGHVAYPDLAKNPIHYVIPVLNELLKIKWDQGNKFFPPTSMQITNIRSENISNNTIPGYLFVQFNLRFSTELTDDIIKKRIEIVLKKHKLNYDIEWCFSGRPFLTKHSKLINTVFKSILKFNKIKPKLLNTGGTSDGRFIAKVCSQIVEFGPVNSTIHKVNECINILDLKLLALIYQNIIEQLIV